MFLLRWLIKAVQFLYQPFPRFDAAIIYLLQASYNAVWDGAGVLIGSFSLALMLVPLGIKCAIAFAHMIIKFELVDLLTLIFFTTLYPMLVLRIYTSRDNAWKQQKSRNRLQTLGKFDIINKLALKAQSDAPVRFIGFVVDGLMFYFAYDLGMYLIALIMSCYVDCLMVRERNPDRFKLPALSTPKTVSATQ